MRKQTRGTEAMFSFQVCVTRALPNKPKLVLENVVGGLRTLPAATTVFINRFWLFKSENTQT